MPSKGFPYYFSTYLGITLQCTLLKKNKDMNYWTHSSFRRLWFTRKVSLSARTPSSLILLPKRLQNVRQREMRGGSSIHRWVANQQYYKAWEFILRSRVTLSQDKQYSWEMQCSARLNVWSWAWVFQGLVNSKAVHLDLIRPKTVRKLLFILILLMPNRQLFLPFHKLEQLWYISKCHLQALPINFSTYLGTSLTVYTV